MPSEDRAVRALEAVAGEREAFRSAVARAVDEVGSLLERQSSAAGAERSGRSLGRMAEGRIDVDRFASLFSGAETLEPDAAEQLERAHRVLSDVHRAGDEPYRVRLDGGGDLRDAVADAAARLGRAFGAARTVELTRTGRYRLEDHGGYVDAFPFRMWNGRERELAPPLVVELPGTELRPAGLSEFLDGSLKLVLVVDGPAPPAALVRLITPGVLVLQVEDPGALSALEEREGPAVAALFPDGSDAVARFVHDPDGPDGLAGRLTVEHLPGEDLLRPVGRTPRSQQLEELRQLAVLAGAGPAEPPSGNGRPEEGAPGEVEPADRLAGWLLRQSGLDQVEG